MDERSSQFNTAKRSWNDRLTSGEPGSFFHKAVLLQAHFLSRAIPALVSASIPLSSLMETACQVYTKLLSQRGHGYALWEPEPTEAGEVLIGDVGYIHDGGFYRLFNATLPEDDPVNVRSGVPEGYEPFVYPDSLRHTRNRAIQPGPICSKHVAAVDVEAGASMTAGVLGASVGVTGKIRFRCADEQAAVLVLKQHAVRDSVHRPEGLERYIKLNHKSWCRFARDVARISIEDEEIVFVSGFVKTAQWALAAAAYHAKAGEFLFGGEFGPSAKATFSVETTTTSVMSVEQRCSGVRPSALYPNLAGDRFDQCIFVHRYKFKNRLSLFPTVLRAAAQDDTLDPPRSPPHHDDHSEHCGSVVAGDEFDSLSPNSYKPDDLLDGILQYILEWSDAECAIASDHDLTELFADMDHDGPILAASDIREALIAQNRQVSVTNDGVGTLDHSQNHPHTVNDSSISVSTVGNPEDSTQESPSEYWQERDPSVVWSFEAESVHRQHARARSISSEGSRCSGEPKAPSHARSRSCSVLSENILLSRRSRSRSCTPWRSSPTSEDRRSRSPSVKELSNSTRETSPTSTRMMRSKRRAADLQENDSGITTVNAAAKHSPTRPRKKRKIASRDTSPTFGVAGPSRIDLGEVEVHPPSQTRSRPVAALDRRNKNKKKARIAPQARP